MLRTLQRVLFGGGRVASVISFSFFVSEITGFLPRPGASSSPANPKLANRRSHRMTEGRVTPAPRSLPRLGCIRLLEAKRCAPVALSAAVRSAAFTMRSNQPVARRSTPKIR